MLGTRQLVSGLRSLEQVNAYWSLRQDLCADFARRYDPGDDDLAALDASHLFEPQVTWVGYRKSALLTGYLRNFVALLVPHLPAKMLRQMEKVRTQDDMERQLGSIAIPTADQRLAAVRSASTQ